MIRKSRSLWQLEDVKLCRIGSLSFPHSYVSSAFVNDTTINANTGDHVYWMAPWHLERWLLYQDRINLNGWYCPNRQRRKPHTHILEQNGMAKHNFNNTTFHMHRSCWLFRCAEGRYDRFVWWFTIELMRLRAGEEDYFQWVYLCDVWLLAHIIVHFTYEWRIGKGNSFDIIIIIIIIIFERSTGCKWMQHKGTKRDLIKILIHEGY